jgi:hypothetical protein
MENFRAGQLDMFWPVPYWAGTEKNAKAFVQKKMMPVTTTEL